MYKCFVKYLVLVTILILVFCISGFAQHSARVVMIHVDDTPTTMGKSQIEQNLIRVLSRNANLRVFSTKSENGNLPPLPGDFNNPDTLADWCAESGCRYLLTIKIYDEKIVRKKGFHFPLLFHKYQTEGIIEAEVRLFDASRNRFVIAESMKVKEKGPRVFQATMDDDINDPDLHLTSLQKIKFISTLENKFCREVYEKLEKSMPTRNGYSR